MQIKNHPTASTITKQIQLPRPDGNNILLTLTPLPLGFHARLRKNGIIPPQPPTKVARDSSGQPLRDKQGQALLTTNDQDPEYLNELELYHQRLAVLVLVESLKHDPNIQFDTQPPLAVSHESSTATNSQTNTPSWATYADNLYHELEAANWTAGDLIHLCDEIARLSNLLTDHVEAAQRNFSKAPPPTTSRTT